MDSSSRSRLTQFNSLESYVENSIGSVPSESINIPKETSDQTAQTENASPAIESKRTSTSPTQTIQPKTKASDCAEDSRIAVFTQRQSADLPDTHVVGSNKLNNSRSKHLEKNEKLIKALEGLRSRMKEKGLKSGKIIREEN